MFGYFRSRKKSEQRRRCDLFYEACVAELEDYVKKHPDPSREDLILIAVNAKITYDLFRNVSHIKKSARKLLHPLITNGLAVFISIDMMEERAALQEMQSLVRNVVDSLLENDTSDLTLPAIERAFNMSKIINFHEMV